ncbi:MAG: hypothetical protein AVDCRST_MAG31-916 [uncultured Sphingomonas sp.]|uniref:Uncharacterized protein n=1 Tax=uncultured Sphingomonas sp. TaxID=158754 RepID=A0A6J4T2C5_9SPHN|nr:MAG: hypothetical protein AVDCRST_MAG31-916 [uncultured Sphingomonas sp.]
MLQGEVKLARGLIGSVLAGALRAQLWKGLGKWLRFLRAD